MAETYVAALEKALGFSLQSPGVRVKSSPSGLAPLNNTSIGQEPL